MVAPVNLGINVAVWLVFGLDKQTIKYEDIYGGIPVNLGINVALWLVFGLDK